MVNYIYKVQEEQIIKEKVVANPWYCITTIDAHGYYNSYNIHFIDTNYNIFSHILLAYKYLTSSKGKYIDKMPNGVEIRW